MNRQRGFKPLKVALATSLALVWAARSDAVTIFSTDFEAGTPAEVTGAGGRVASQGYSSHGFGSFLYQNTSPGNPASATNLTLSGLPSHTTLSLSFLLAIIDSWDGDPGNCCSPDHFNVTVDGVPVFNHTFSAFDVNGDSYPGAPLAFGSNIFDGGGGWPDSAYAISLLAIPHSAGTATISFFASGTGWQGGFDESWGIDNLQVDAQAVPEPASLGLLSMGVIGMCILRRWKRRTNRQGHLASCHGETR